MSDLSYRPMEPTETDFERFARSFTQNDSPRELEVVRWQYGANPAGRCLVELAEDAAEDKIAAIYATLRARIQVGHEVRHAVQSVDTLTDIGFRGQGLFKRMARQTFERCVSEGMELIYGFPNGNSAHGFFNRLEWTQLDPVPFLFRPLRLPYFAAKLERLQPVAPWLPSMPASIPVRLPCRPSERIVQGSRFGDAHTALWDAFAADGTCVGLVRDADYLNWRFAKPNEQYRVLELWRGEELRGYVVWALKPKHGGQVGYIMELMYAPGAHRVGVTLLQHVTRQMAVDGADVVLAWCLPHAANFLAYRLCGYLDLPERLRPIELHFGARVFGDSRLALNRDNWYLSYCDSDTV